MPLYLSGTGTIGKGYIYLSPLYPFHEYAMPEDYALSA